MFCHYLVEVQQDTDLVDDQVDMDVYYSLNRTPQKSALTRDKRAGVGKDVQDEMNQWRTEENVNGRQPHVNMRQLYSEACFLMPVTWF